MPIVASAGGSCESSAVAELGVYRVVGETMRAWKLEDAAGSFWVPKSVVQNDVSRGEEAHVEVEQWWLDQHNAAGQHSSATTVDPRIDGAPVRLTRDQRTIVDRAVQAVRLIAEDPDLPEGRAVELICADFLSGQGQ